MPSVAQTSLVASFAPLPPSESLEGGQSALVMVDGRAVGRIGLLARGARERFGIKQEVFAAELSLSELHAVPGEPLRFHPLPRFPAVSRDLSLVCDASRPYRDIEATIRGIGGDRIAEVSVFDRWGAGTLPAGTVGLGVRIVMQDPERTLTSQEVTELLDRIVEALRRDLGATLRD